jgi:hypothetical protein
MPEQGISLGAGEIRESANLINRGNIFRKIREHFLRNTRIHIFICCEWSKQIQIMGENINLHLENGQKQSGDQEMIKISFYPTENTE